MNKDYKYLAFFDLLGTQNFSVNAKDYFDKIRKLQERIQDNCAYLSANGNTFNVAFFSDSCYVESEGLYELLQYIKMLRNDLSSIALFFNAAVIKADVDYNRKISFKNISETYFENGTIHGTMFYDNSVAKAYIAHNRFKGIGVFLSQEVYKDAKKERKIKDELVKSIFLADHQKYESLTIYDDVAFTSISNKMQDRWIAEILKAYFLACSDNERYGKYYVSLLTNIINCASNDIEWDGTKKKFKNSDAIYNTMLSIFIDKNKHSFLTGIDVLAIVFINKILSSSLMTQQKVDIIHSLFDSECIANKYLTNLDSVPWLAFFGNKNNEEMFKKYCHEYIVNKKINDIN